MTELCDQWLIMVKVSVNCHTMLNSPFRSRLVHCALTNHHQPRRAVWHPSRRLRGDKVPSSSSSQWPGGRRLQSSQHGSAWHRLKCNNKVYCVTCNHVQTISTTSNNTNFLCPIFLATTGPASTTHWCTPPKRSILKLYVKSIPYCTAV